MSNMRPFQKNDILTQHDACRLGCKNDGSKARALESERGACGPSQQIQYNRAYIGRPQHSKGGREKTSEEILCLLCCKTESHWMEVGQCFTGDLPFIHLVHSHAPFLAPSHAPSHAPS